MKMDVPIPSWDIRDRGLLRKFERTGKMEGARNFSDGNGGWSSGLRDNEGNNI
jgi:hypothetical protein